MAAFLYTILEYGLLGNLDYYPSTGNPYDFRNALVYSMTFSLMMGLFQGSLEVLWLRRLFRKQKLWVKVVFKSLFYLSLIVGFLLLLTWITNTQRLQKGWLDPMVLESLDSFFLNFAFWSVVFYIGCVFFAGLLLSEISQYLGSGMLSNFFLGKYHRPGRETRIFMFLDMNDSTKIAEQLGHDAYFLLLKDYYSTMSDAILKTSGSIYHYVGDEVVVSWGKEEGLRDQNCLRCFREILSDLDKNKDHFNRTYGILPGCKAAFHLGEVSTGEIGELKKALIYTGDVLNTTARILGLCHQYNAKALVSGPLAKELGDPPGYSLTSVGTTQLRGRIKEESIFRLDWG